MESHCWCCPHIYSTFVVGKQTYSEVPYRNVRHWHPHLSRSGNRRSRNSPDDWPPTVNHAGRLGAYRGDGWSTVAPRLEAQTYKSNDGGGILGPLMHSAFPSATGLMLGKRITSMKDLPVFVFARTPGPDPELLPELVLKQLLGPLLLHHGRLA